MTTGQFALGQLAAKSKSAAGAGGTSSRQPLLRLSQIKGYVIEGGHFGTVKDFLFDDQSWNVRWLVVDTGSWLTERKVLVHPSAIRTGLETVDQNYRRPLHTYYGCPNFRDKIARHIVSSNALLTPLYDKKMGLVLST